MGTSPADIDEPGETLFTWLHLSDVHFGHGPASHRWDQQLVLKALKDDLERLADRAIPAPNALIVTGDVAFSGSTAEYRGAASWLEEILNPLRLTRTDVFIVPGNHDVQRDAGIANRNSRRLLELLRSGNESLDEALAHPPDRALLDSRFENYLEFSRGFSPKVDSHESTTSSTYWHSQRTATLGLVIRFVGLNTAYLSADDQDKGRLRLGREQLAKGLASLNRSSGELVVVLSHHPFDWLADRSEIEPWVTAQAHVHLSGHVHTAESERLRRGGGGEIVRVVSGAAHGPFGVSAGHGYSIGSVVVRTDGAVRLRVWPRSWSDSNKDFRLSVEQIPEGATFVDHDLRLRMPGGAQDYPTGGSGSPRPESGEKKLHGPMPGAPSLGVGSGAGELADPGYYREFPPLVTAFVGREREVELLRERTPVVGITGLGGQGKSALTAHYLETAGGQYEFVDWRDCREEGNKIHTQLISIIEGLTGGRVRGEQLAGTDDAALVRLFFEVLGKVRGLFVFDNIDHYVDLERGRATGALALLLDQALRGRHNARFIVTCRPTLQYEGDGFLQIRLSGLSLGEAERLFELRGVANSESDVKYGIREAHRLTEGHALWLNLIATQVARATATLDTLVSDLKRSRSSHLPNAMLRSIWRTLTEKQRSVLRCLAEAVRPETEDRLAEYVTSFLNWNQYTRAVRTLRVLDLVVVKPNAAGRDSFELHPLIREFVRSEYSKKDREGFIAIICGVFDRMIVRLKPQLGGSLPLSILETWTQRAELAMNRGDYKEALGLLHDVGEGLLRNGYAEEFVRIGERMFAEMDWTEAVLEKYQYFDSTIREQAIELSYLGRYDEADRLADRYQGVIVGKSARYINLCDMRCYSYWLRGELEKAKEWGRQGVELKTSTGIDTAFDCSHNLALVQRDSGEVEPALKYFLKDRTIEELLLEDSEDSEESDDVAAHVFGNVGRCLWLQGDAERAVTCLRRSARMLERESHASTGVNQGWAALWIGELLEATEDCELAYLFYRRAVSKWKWYAPAKMHTAEGRASDLRARKTDLGVLDRLSEMEVERRCRGWIEV